MLFQDSLRLHCLSISSSFRKKIFFGTNLPHEWSKLYFGAIHRVKRCPRHFPLVRMCKFTWYGWMCSVMLNSVLHVSPRHTLEQTSRYTLQNISISSTGRSRRCILENQAVDSSGRTIGVVSSTWLGSAGSSMALSVTTGISLSLDDDAVVSSSSIWCKLLTLNFNVWQTYHLWETYVE